MFCPTSPLCSPDRYTSLCGRTSHSGTGCLCLCKLKRVLCCAMLRMCVCVRLLADLCMPISGFCITSRKSQEKQNWTLCKQPVTNFWSVRPALYLHYQLCSLRISCFQWQGVHGVSIVSAGCSKCCMSLPTVFQCQLQSASIANLQNLWPRVHIL